MQLAISNIAWQPHEEEAVANLMQAYRFEGVEIAPTKTWANPLQAGESEITSFRNLWEKRGIQIVAMQALLFGRPELTLFGEETSRRETLEYLQGMIRLASKLGVKVLVFGSPKNRKTGALSQDEIDRIAIPLFRALGEHAAKHDVTFCIEPNPAQYDCDFVTTSLEGLALVKQIDHEGFGLHLDAGGMTLSQEPIDSVLAECLPAVRHFHASEPMLAPLGDGSVDHPRFASALKQGGYANWVSIEMRPPGDGAPLASIEAALAAVKRHYSEN